MLLKTFITRLLSRFCGHETTCATPNARSLSHYRCLRCAVVASETPTSLNAMTYKPTHQFKADMPIHI